jgi:hypothetical protein
VISSVGISGFDGEIWDEDPPVAVFSVPLSAELRHATPRYATRLPPGPSVSVTRWAGLTGGSLLEEWPGRRHIIYT